MFHSWHREMPDYSIQQVEQAEYQLPRGFSGNKSFSLIKNPLVWVVILLLIGAVYLKKA